MKIKVLYTVLVLVLLSALFSGCNQNKTDIKKEENKETITSHATEHTTIPTRQTTTTAPQKTGKLSGFKVLIDAGHGCTKTYTEPVGPGSSETRVESPYTGTCGVATNKKEGDLTLEVAQLLEKKLKKLDATVYMIRRTKGTTMSLQDRSDYGNSKNVDLAFRIHADGLDDSSVNGASMLYPAPDYVGNDISEQSKSAAEIILPQYIQATNLYNRGTVARGDLTGFNFTKVPCILIELGFMTNPEEDVKMSQRDFQQKMVAGIAKGMIDYYNTIK